MSKLIKTESEMLTHILKATYVAEIAESIIPLPVEPKDERARLLMMLDSR